MSEQSTDELQAERGKAAELQAELAATRDLELQNSRLLIPYLVAERDELRHRLRE